MTPDVHEHHGGHQPQPQPPPQLPKPLLPNPTVTIYFDGLIYTAYNEKQRLYQAAILTQAEGHHLTIEVRLRGQEKLLWPVKGTDWDPNHTKVKEGAPFWLYIDSGQGIQANEHSAKLHAPEGADEQSFRRVLNFEELHKRPLKLKPETFAEFNFPHGLSYSAENTEADLKLVPQNIPGAVPQFKSKIQVSTLAAIDIDAVSNGTTKRSIVLANHDGEDEFFRFVLEPGKHYEIKILNEPIVQNAVRNHNEHFLQFYELFDLKQGESKFLVDPGTAHPAVHSLVPLPPAEGAEVPVSATLHSPPCVSTSGNLQTGLY
jgi:hypothetical protein